MRHSCLLFRDWQSYSSYSSKNSVLRFHSVACWPTKPFPIFCLSSSNGFHGRMLWTNDFSHSMSETRFKICKTKIGITASSLKLCTLPPTSEAFKENTKRAHFKSIVWLSLQDINPTYIDPGWKKDGQIKPLNPVLLPCLAPDFILKLIKCGCQSTSPCSTRMCVC